MKRNDRNQWKYPMSLLITAAIALYAFGAYAENIDPDSTGCKYAWAENVGWINFKPSQGPGVTVTDTTVTGMAWGENIGWINLSSTNGGVVNDGLGNLSGYAWGENVGWINFRPSGGGVSIRCDGKFSGYAWGENIGWINFSFLNSCVKTSWVSPTPIDDGNPCTSDVCDPVTGNVMHTPAADGTPCDDNFFCNGTDTCSGGICSVHSGNPCIAPLICNETTDHCDNLCADAATRCNDNNPCTDDVCVGGVCQHNANTAACDDGDPCTVNDVCANKVCKGTPMNCNDNNPCTDDVCVGGVCQHNANSAACDDGDPCTVKDVCANKVCKGMPMICNDGKACTTDTCSNGVCVYAPKCPAGQSCNANGNCSVTCSLVCNDNNPCTDDTLDAVNCKCVFAPKAVGAACDDRNACTTNDKCVKIPIVNRMVCLGTAVANGTYCDDGNLCTTGDACYFGFCVGKPKNRNDNNPCTIDSCDPATGSCKTVAKPDGTACKDGNLCTVNDTCQSGICMAGSAKVCDDHNPCTKDTCDPKSGCKYTPLANGTACDDANLCTVNDSCQSGVCKGTLKDCNDHNLCTADSCNAKTGQCVHTFNKPKSVTVLGDHPFGATSTQNKQIQTLFAVTNGGCVISSGTNYVFVSTGSVVDFNWKAGVGPNPTTVKLDNVAYTPIPDHGSVTCSDATTAHTIYLDNLKAAGGKDRDTITVKGSAAD